MDEIRELVETLLAVETLEYHDANLLHGSNESRCRWKMARYRQILGTLEKIQAEERKRKDKSLRERSAEEWQTKQEMSELAQRLKDKIKI